MERSTALKIVKQFMLCVITVIILFYGNAPILQWTKLNYMDQVALIFIITFAIIFTLLLWRKEKKPAEKTQLSDDEIKAKFGYKKINHHGPFTMAETADGLFQYIDPETGEPY